MEKLKGDEKTAHIPVIFLTAKIDPASEVEGLNLGAVDYITKPFSRELLIKRIDLHLLFEKQKKELLNYSLSLETEVDKQTQTVLELQNAIIKIIAELVESRDSITGGHIERTQHYIRLLIDFLLEHDVYTEEISSWDVNLFVMSSQLHDVGKITIKDAILMKPGKLSEDEFEIMKHHTVSGVEIIKRIEETTTSSEFLTYASALAGSHHEQWSGKGYPYGLKGTEIPLHGRIMAIVDVYDALTNDRPYKKAFPHEEAIGIIKENSGTHFDPKIAEVFLLHEKEFENFKAENTVAVHKSNDSQHAMEVVSNIIGAKTGKETAHEERMRRYLELMVNKLKGNNSYKDEISKWCDGTGDPHGFKDKGSPLQGKIMAVVDAYESLTSDRPHRERKTHQEAVEIIRNGSGTHFDPELVKVFLECEAEFSEIEHTGSD